MYASQTRLGLAYSRSILGRRWPGQPASTQRTWLHRDKARKRPERQGLAPLLATVPSSVCPFGGVYGVASLELAVGVMVSRRHLWLRTLFGLLGRVLSPIAGKPQPDIFRKGPAPIHPRKVLGNGLCALLQRRRFPLCLHRAVSLGFRWATGFSQPDYSVGANTVIRASCLFFRRELQCQWPRCHGGHA